MIPDRDPSTNLAVLSALTEQLERYLQGGELTRRVVCELPGGREAATLTIGVLVALTESLERNAHQLSEAEREKLTEELRRQAHLREVHRPAYATKLARELKSHLDSWEWFLDDCVREEPSCREDYESEVWLRSRIEDLIDHADQHGFDVGSAKDRAAEADELLRSVFVPGEYVGPAGKRELYPPDKYWWLYGKPE